MKFREYDNLKPVVITVDSQDMLTQTIEDIASEHNIIDLQFSTDVINCHKKGQVIVYHALLLVEKHAKQSN